MNTENPNTTDLEDRLVDQALRETFGGETPPDLREQILAAASEQVGEIATLATSDEVTNGIPKNSRKRWALLAIAASLLVATGLVFPAVQSTRELARRSEMTIANTRELTVDTDTSGVVSDGKPADKMQMMVEPQVVFEEAEPAGSLGIVPASEPESGLEGLTSDYGSGPSQSSAPAGLAGKGYGGSAPAFTEDLDGPFRQSTFEGLEATVGEIEINERNFDQPAERLWESLQKRRAKYDSVDLSALQGESVSQDNPSSERDSTARSEYFGENSQQNTQVNPEAKGRDGKNADLLARRGRRTRSAWGFLGGDNKYWLEEVPRGQGSGPGTSGDKYTRIYENPFVTVDGDDAVSTFSIDVDTASYANVRQFLMQSRALPPPDAVRLEELINYFDYDYSGPTGEVPFAAHMEIAGCPWQPEHRLVRIGIKGREIERKSRPQSNLVFLIDVSGSMNEQSKLPLLVEGMKLLTRELGENDRVAIVVYASSEGLALPSTRGDKQDTILSALERLRAGGSTAGGAGIQLAYQIAQDHFIEGGVNRVILATDGDFNVGTTSTAELERMAETKAKETGVFLTVLGFGRGNLNDAMMEAISGKGNGNYHYIDNRTEARKVLVEEMAGTLVTIAKDVKIQVEFNPEQVAGYRLLGYENRMLRAEDFNDDKKDAGEIGAGHTVTALYEIVPAGKAVDSPPVDPLKYQQSAPRSSNRVPSEGPRSDELMTLKIRYKQPDGDTSTKLEFPITDAGQPFAEATGDFKFAAAVASFGMLLRDSEHRGETSYDAVLEIAEDGSTRDPHDYRTEFLQMVRQAKSLAGE